MVPQKTFKNTPRTLGPSVPRGTEGHQNGFYAKIATRMLRACYAHGLGGNPEKPAAHGRALCSLSVTHGYALVCRLWLIDMRLYAVYCVQIYPCTPSVAHGCALWLMDVPLYVGCNSQICPCMSSVAYSSALVHHVRLIDMPLYAICGI
jgi:hypothetical protein